MQLSSDRIQEFRVISADEFGVELSDADAEQHALRVLNVFWILIMDDTLDPMFGDMPSPSDTFDSKSSRGIL